MNMQIIDNFVHFNLSHYQYPIIRVFYNIEGFEEQYVAQLFELDEPTPYCICSSSLNGIRAAIPPTLTKYKKDYDDAEEMVEIYLRANRSEKQKSHTE